MISLDAMPIPMARGRGFAWVSPEDWPYVKGCKWHIRKSRDKQYASSHHIGCAGHTVGHELHRVIARLMGIDNAPQVDHKDGDGLNCTRQNLRGATKRQNILNRRPKLVSEGGTGFRGVSRSGRKFLAQIRTGGPKHRHLGVFDTPEAAARVYDRWAAEAHGEFAWINFPGDL